MQPVPDAQWYAATRRPRSDADGWSRVTEHIRRRLAAPSHDGDRDDPPAADAGYPAATPARTIPAAPGSQNTSHPRHTPGAPTPLHLRRKSVVSAGGQTAKGA